MNILAGKKLLILGGAAQCAVVVECAKKMGIHTIVTDITKKTYAKEIADEALDYSVMDYEGLYQYCLENPIDGVFNYNIDFSQNTHQILCERLGLKSYGTKEQYHLLIDKVDFKKFCAENNVDIIPEYTENEVESIPYPIIVKPCEGSGSRGIYICNNSSEAKIAIEKSKACSRNGEVIIEKYLGNNQDLTILYLVKNGNPNLIMLGDRYQGRKEDGLDRQINCIFLPSRYTDLYMENVNERVIQMIKNLGIKDGPVFIQGFVDGDTVRMYDPAIRFPGNEYGRIYEKANNINLIEEMIKFSLSGELNVDEEKLFDSFRLQGQRAVEYMVCVGPGKMGSFNGLDQLGHVKEIIDVRQKRFEGEMIEQTGDIKHRGAEISVLSEDVCETVVNIVKSIQETVTCESEDGKDMIISPFDYSKIGELYYNK